MCRGCRCYSDESCVCLSFVLRSPGKIVQGRGSVLGRNATRQGPGRVVRASNVGDWVGGELGRALLLLPDNRNEVQLSCSCCGAETGVLAVEERAPLSIHDMRQALIARDSREVRVRNREWSNQRRPTQRLRLSTIDKIGGIGSQGAE